MTVYVGKVNVDTHIIGFFSNKRHVLNARFGATEIKDYNEALKYLEKKLVKGANAAGRKKIRQRFNTYRQVVATSECAQKASALPTLKAMYDELTEVIESSAFKSIPKSKQDAIVALQAETFAILKVEDAFPKSGTAAEKPSSAPLPGYKADQRTLGKVPAKSPVTKNSEGVCVETLGDVSGGEEDDRRSSVNNMPFTGNILDANSAINTDIRYRINYKPKP